MSGTSTTTAPTRPTSTERSAERSGAVASASRRVQMPVRRKVQAETFSAFQLDRDETFHTDREGDVEARKGDWVVTRGATIVDILPHYTFQQRYETADERLLTLTGAQRSAVEQALGFGSTETADHLVTAAQRLARLKVGAIDIVFTPGQWEHLAHRAEKMGLSVEALCRRLVDRITLEFFDHV